MAGVSTLSKIFGGLILDHQRFISRNTFLAFAMFITALSNLVAAKATRYWHFCIFSIIYGVGEGCFVGQLPVAVVDLLPSKEKVGVAIGNLFALISIPIMLGPVIAG